MKKLFCLITLISLSVCAGRAQTIPQDALNLGGDFLNGPWGISTIYGRSFTGEGKNLAGVLVTYDLVTNDNNTGFSSGPIAGYDEVFGIHQHEINTLSGGWDFGMTGHPLSFIGTTSLTNIETTEIVYQLVATPRGGNDIGSITGTAFIVNVGEWNGFHGKLIAAYENRNGQNQGNGNWGLLGVAITHKF